MGYSVSIWGKVSLMILGPRTPLHPKECQTLRPLRSQAPSWEASKEGVTVCSDRSSGSPAPPPRHLVSEDAPAHPARAASLWLPFHTGVVWDKGFLRCRHLKPEARGTPAVPLGTPWEGKRAGRGNAFVSPVATPWGQGQAPWASSAPGPCRPGEQRGLRPRGRREGGVLGTTSGQALHLGQVVHCLISLLDRPLVFTWSGSFLGSPPAPSWRGGAHPRASAQSCGCR